VAAMELGETGALREQYSDVKAREVNEEEGESVEVRVATAPMHTHSLFAHGSGTAGRKLFAGAPNKIPCARCS
jgi:hypothetical protein